MSDGDKELDNEGPRWCSWFQLTRVMLNREIPLEVSLMPSGLVSAMTKDDLIDLVEYPNDLKKERKIG